MRKQTGSANIGVVIVLVVALIGALGFVFWQNFPRGEVKDQHTTDISEPTAEDSTEPAGDGVITGSFTFPSEDIPSNIEVHAINLATEQEFVTSEHIQDDRFRYGVGYRLAVPAGEYHVYALKFAGDDTRAYYTNFVECGFNAEGCENSEERITVTVEPSKDTKDIMTADWYNPCLIPGREQPVEAFPLPTC